MQCCSDVDSDNDGSAVVLRGFAYDVDLRRAFADLQMAMACRIVLTCVLYIPIRFSFVVVAFQMFKAMAWRIAMMSVQTTEKQYVSR